MVLRKAERVLPEPVGAAMRVSRPRRMAGQPLAWGGVTVSKREVNQRFTAGWNVSSTVLVLRGVRAIRGAFDGVRPFYAAQVAGRNAGMAGVGLRRPIATRVALWESIATNWRKSVYCAAVCNTRCKFAMELKEFLAKISFVGYLRYNCNDI